MIYLDANATEPLRPEARAAMLRALDLAGNPSSVHGAGRAARRMLEESREAVASQFGVLPADVVFTAGGTEANAAAIHGLGRNRRIIVGATEHDAVLRAAPEATLLPVDRDGIADLAALERILADGVPSLICLMAANNETGALQPIEDVSLLCRRHQALLHVDAVQAAGRIGFDLRAAGADSAALSAHKMGGPKGAGALLLRAGLHLPALVVGGGQERGRRGGTEPLPAIAGFAAAIAAPDDPSRLAPLRDRAETAAMDAGAIVVGGTAPRLPNTTCLALPGMRADTQVIALDLAGIAVSAGAACSSGKVARSRVIDAMGLPELADCAIRVSLPWNVSPADIEAFVLAYARMAARRLARGPAPVGG